MKYFPREQGANLAAFLLSTVPASVIFIVLLALAGPALGNVFSNVVSTPTSTPTATATASGTPTTLTVTKLADTNDGVCDSDCSLREAVSVSPADSIINFASGLTGTITIG